MKTTMNISVSPELKKEFSAFAESIETTPTNLLNMMMRKIVNTQTFTFERDNDIGVLHTIEHEDLNEKEKKSYNAIRDKKLDELDLVDM